ncbi:MAG: hypothetical protein GXP16_19980 [Gammaproteobacteria bacterium]|nr:hypothetical protein [Gammaproteobacteria bacterium]
MEILKYQYIVFPMAALALLTFVVLVMLFLSRLSAVKNGSLSAGFFKTYTGQSEPEQSRKLARHFANLFEAPILFYVVCLSGLSTHLSFGLFQVFAWLYVTLRLIHATVHIGKNKLQPRIAAYFSGWIVLIAMWLLLIYRLIGDT